MPRESVIALNCSLSRVAVTTAPGTGSPLKVTWPRYSEAPDRKTAKQVSTTNQIIKPEFSLEDFFDSTGHKNLDRSFRSPANFLKDVPRGRSPGLPPVLYPVSI